VTVQVKDTIARFTALRQQAAGATDAGAQAFIRWFLADRSTRTISPLSRITVQEYQRGRSVETEAGPNGRQ
jgi:hypothetical protein